MLVEMEAARLRVLVKRGCTRGNNPEVYVSSAKKRTPELEVAETTSINSTNKTNNLGHPDPSICLKSPFHCNSLHEKLARNVKLPCHRIRFQVT